MILQQQTASYKKYQRKLNTLMNDIFTSFVYIALIWWTID